MRPRWRKVLHDLFDNKARTLLVVFSIAVGVFSIGVIAGAYEIISKDMSASYAANQPANIDFLMENFDEDVLTSVRNAKTINEAEARRVFNVRVRVAGTEKWSTLDVVAFHDFAKNNVNLLRPLEGTGEPRKREVLLEQNALKDFNVGVGGKLEFQLPDGSTEIMPVVGVVQDIAMGAGDFLASPHAYMTMDTLPYMQQPELYNHIYATVSESGDDILHLRTVGADLKDKLEKGEGDATVIRMRFALSQDRKSVV